METLLDDTLPEHHPHSPTIRCSSVSAQFPAPTWQPILYAKQGYPDNYVPADFMQHGIVYGVVRLSYIPLCCECICIAVQSTIVILFAVIYTLLQHCTVQPYSMHTITSTTLIFVDLLLIDAGAVLYRILAKSLRSTRVHTIVRAAILITILAAVSPVLCTLTESYSSDTIYTLSTLLALLHLIAFDYSYIINALPTDSTLYDNDVSTTVKAADQLNKQSNNSDTMNTETSTDDADEMPTILQSDKLSNTISFNSAMFMSVMLGSRFTDINAVFSLLLFAFICYAGLPLLSVLIRRYSLRLYNVCSILLFTLTASLLYTISTVYVQLYGVFVCTVVLVIPSVLQYFLRFKQQISGQWDFDELENEEYS